MYYHARPLKFVEYGKVTGNPEPGDEWKVFYTWLSNYCGYFPQVWLSRSRSMITGIRNDSESILFGFDVIKGFPLHYAWWEMIMGEIWSAYYHGMDPVKDLAGMNESIWNGVKRFYEPDDDDTPEQWKEYLESISRHIPGDPHDFDSVDDWLRSCVFVKHDQVVVPSLNLRSAKEVFCRSEREKRILRKMGFIEDRIKIRKFTSWW